MVGGFPAHGVGIVCENRDPISQFACIPFDLIGH